MNNSLYVIDFPDGEKSFPVFHVAYKYIMSYLRWYMNHIPMHDAEMLHYHITHDGRFYSFHLSHFSRLYDLPEQWRISVTQSGRILADDLIYKEVR